MAQDRNEREDWERRRRDDDDHGRRYYGEGAGWNEDPYRDRDHDARSRGWRPSGEDRWRDRDEDEYQRRVGMYGGGGFVTGTGRDIQRGYGRRGYGGGDRGDYGRGGYDRDREGGREDRGFFSRAADEVSSWFGDDDAERRRQQDARSEGRHRGMGPRGYRRSDERIRDDVNDRLTDDAYIDASDIEVSVENGEVTLSGTVASRMVRRRAEDVAESVSGVGHVQNNIRVRQQAADAGQTGEIGAGSETTTTTGGTATSSAGTGMGGSAATRQRS